VVYPTCPVPEPGVILARRWKESVAQSAIDQAAIRALEQCHAVTRLTLRREGRTGQARHGQGGERA
jgi:hypothetical protein